MAVFRSPRFRNQRVADAALLEAEAEAPVRIRARVRGKHVLPDSWEDITPSCQGVRSWKRYRRTQYRQ